MISVVLIDDHPLAAREIGYYPTGMGAGKNPALLAVFDTGDVAPETDED